VERGGNGPSTMGTRGGKRHVAGRWGDLHRGRACVVACRDRRTVIARHGEGAGFDLVFQGGSGSTPDEIAEAVGYGVVKMNLDSDAQYAYTRAVAGHMFVNYAGVVRADCGIGDKHAYDPRTWSRSAEQAMAARGVEACRQLGSAGRSLTGR
jgi:fructose-bisphosphate aldolase class II